MAVSMFWGLKMEPGKRYTTTVDKSFHISKATLDANSVSSENELVSVALEESGGGVFYLTNLRKRDAIASNLDLNFMTGDRITLFCKGHGTVHLTGYMVPDDEDDFANSMIDDEAEEEEGEDEEVEEEEEDDDIIMNNLKSKKQKNDASKKRKQEEVKSKNSKKKKLEMAAESDSDEDDEMNGSNMGMGNDDDDDEEEEDSDLDEEGEDESDEEEPPTLVQQKKKQKQAEQSPKQKQNTTPSKTLNGTASPQQAKEGKKGQEKQKGQQGEMNLTGGVKIKDIRPGNGPVCKSGRAASVYYTGRLKSNGKVFDSVTQGSGFKFRVGQGEVIKAWDIGVAGMKVGGKRIITCPPQVAYGQKGSPPQIPPNATLVFEVELRAVH